MRCLRLVLGLAVLCISLWAFSASGAQGASSGSSKLPSDPTWEEYVKKNNVKLFDGPLPVRTKELDENNFDQSIRKGKWVLFFHVAWNAQARRMHSIWDEFTVQSMSEYPDLKFGRINCDLWKSLCFDRLNITKWPFIVGAHKGRMVGMTEDESNKGLHEFVVHGWYRREPGVKIPPVPNPYLLRFEKVVRGLERLLGVPVEYMAYAVATGTALFVLFMSWFVCVFCCCDKQTSPEHLERVLQKAGALDATTEPKKKKKKELPSSSTPTATTEQASSGDDAKSKPVGDAKLKRRKKTPHAD